MKKRNAYTIPGRAQVESVMLDGQRGWELSTLSKPPKMDWVGSLRRYAKVGTHSVHSMETIRAKIMNGMVKADLD